MKLGEFWESCSPVNSRNRVSKDGGRKRRRGGEGYARGGEGYSRDDGDRDDDVVEAGIPQRHKKSKRK